MNFRQVSTTRAVSECGRIDIYFARGPHGQYYNGWVDGKHVTAGYSKTAVKEACIQRALSTTASTTGETSSAGESRRESASADEGSALEALC